MNAFTRYDAQGRLIEERPLTILEAAEMHGLKVARSVVEPGDKPWRVVRRTTKSNAHAIAWLKRLAIDYYHPMMRELRPLSRKRMSARQRSSNMTIMRPCLVPLFPGYIFIRLDLARDRWDTVREIVGVGGVVCEGNLPVEISARLIGEIMAREVGGVVPGKTPAALIFRPGDCIRVKDGPLADLMGEIERMPDYTIGDIDGDTRIRVAVELFGRPTSVDLALGQVEKL